jgi:hypothetical protein
MSEAFIGASSRPSTNLDGPNGSIGVLRMVPAEHSSHSFIVKIWLEEEATADVPPFWRGHVTHVASGSRCYVQDSADLLAFMNRYLQQWESVSSSGEAPVDSGGVGE